MPMFFATLGVVAASVERLATEIRHLQRTEVLEAEEYFSEGQKGSSAMPHKRNPVLTENLTGLARMVRSAVTPALENVALWHERDISHSSVERMIAPDATVTLDFALARLAGRHRQADRLSRQHAEKSRPPRRARPLAARAAGADAKGRRARGRLPLRQAGRFERPRNDEMRDPVELILDGLCNLRVLMTMEIRPDRGIRIDILAPVHVPQNCDRLNDDGLFSHPVLHLRERMPEVAMVLVSE